MLEGRIIDRDARASHDDGVEYALAIALALVHLVVAGFAAWLILLVSFWSENVTPEQAAENDWLAWVSPLVLLVAVLILVGALLERWQVGALALGVEVVVAAVVLGYAVGESVHSDGQLLLFGIGMLGVASGSVALSAASARRQRELGRPL